MVLTVSLMVHNKCKRAGAMAHGRMGEKLDAAPCCQPCLIFVASALLVTPWAPSSAVEHYVDKLQFLAVRPSTEKNEYVFLLPCVVTPQAPSSAVEDYVDKLQFLGEVRENEKRLDGACNEIHDLYNLIDDYGIAVTPMDRAAYATMDSTYNTLKTTMEEVEGARDDHVAKYSANLEQGAARAYMCDSVRRLLYDSACSCNFCTLNRGPGSGLHARLPFVLQVAVLGLGHDINAVLVARRHRVDQQGGDGDPQRGAARDGAERGERARQGGGVPAAAQGGGRQAHGGWWVAVRDAGNTSLIQVQASKFRIQGVVLCCVVPRGTRHRRTVCGCARRGQA